MADEVLSKSEENEKESQEQIENKNKEFAKKTKKKKPKKVISRKRLIITLAIIAVLGALSGFGIGEYILSGRIDPNRYNYSTETLLDDVSAIKKEAVGKTPEQLGATKSCVLAFDKTFNYDKVSIVGEGSVKAMGVTQSINAKTIRVNNKLYYENISISSFVQALNRYYVVGEDISHYGGKINDKTVTWNQTPDNTKDDSIKTMTQYKEQFGCTMFDYMTYIVSSKTVVDEGSVNKNDDSSYTFTLVLDKSKSVVNYVKTMKATGGLSQYPDFTSDPVITVTIDKDYRILVFKSSETYNAKIGIINAGSVGTLVNTFTYDQDFAIPALEDKSQI